MADKKDKKAGAKGAKDSKDSKADKKDKKGKKGGAEATGGASVASHPRARAAVRRAKGIGGLVGFALAAYISRSAGISHTQMLERALIAGIAGYLLVWACAVAVWRHIVVAEMRAVYDRHTGAGIAQAARAAAADAAASAREGAASGS